MEKFDDTVKKSELVMGNNELKKKMYMINYKL